MANDRTFCGKLLPYGTGTRCIFPLGHDGKCDGPRVPQSLAMQLWDKQEPQIITGQSMHVYATWESTDAKD